MDVHEYNVITKVIEDLENAEFWNEKAEVGILLESALKKLKKIME